MDCSSESGKMARSLFYVSIVYLIENMDFVVLMMRRRMRKRFWFFSDGIHLSPVGNKVVFKEVLKVLKEADWKPSLYWRSMKNEFDEDSPYDPFFDDGRPYNNLSNWVLPDNDYWD